MLPVGAGRGVGSRPCRASQARLDSEMGTGVGVGVVLEEGWEPRGDIF